MMKILIIGGGIGGLTTTIALQHMGFDAHVYESEVSDHSLFFSLQASGCLLFFAPGPTGTGLHRLRLRWSSAQSLLASCAQAKPLALANG